MPINDYIETLTKRTYIDAWNGSDMVKTPVNTSITGFVSDFSGYEKTQRQQAGLGAVAGLYNASESLTVEDRIIWRTREYEVVYKYDSQFNTYYDLRLVDDQQ